MTVLRTVLLAVIVVMAGVFAWLAFQWSMNSSNGGDQAYGAAFELVDQRGNIITEQAFQGKPTALFFGFTHCPDVCPTTLFELDGWMRKADPAGDGLQAYMVTVDPDRDHPQLLGEYIANVSDRIGGISGDPDKVRQMVKGFNVYFKKVPSETGGTDYAMDHTASIFLLDDRGRFRGTIAYGEDGDVAVKKLENLL